MAHALAEAADGPALPGPEAAAPDATIAFYDREADRYFAATLSNDLAPHRAKLLDRLPAGGLILDAGSGSGRDVLAFLDAGFAVEAFDASAALAARATERTGVRVEVVRFEDWAAPRARYDGVWCFASLLHVARADLPRVLVKLVGSLRIGGWLFASFKRGDGDVVDELGRRYTNLTASGARDLFTGVAGLEVAEVWDEVGPASLGGETAWVYVLARRVR